MMKNKEIVQAIIHHCTKTDVQVQAQIAINNKEAR